MTDTIHPPADPPSARATSESDLEVRVRRLEVAVAEQSLAVDEDAVADRVIEKLSAFANGPRPTPATDRILVLDAPPDPPPEPQPFVATPPPPDGAVLRPPAAPVDPADRRWFLTQLWTEVRLVFRMYFDPRYRLSRTAQFVLPGILLLLVFNYFFFSVWVSIVFVSPVVERVLAVVLGILGYKILVRETTRYRQVLDYLAKYGQQR